MNFDLPSGLALLGLTGPGVENAAVHGVFIFLALILVGLLAILAWLSVGGGDRRAWERQRALERRSLLSAVRAEVRMQWQDLERLGDLAAFRSHLVERINAGRWVQPPYAPMAPRLAQSVVVPDLLEQIARVDEDLMPATIAYYRQLALVTDYAGEFSGPRYQALATEQRIDLVDDFFHALTRLKRVVLDLNARLEQSLKLKKKARDTAMAAALEERARSAEIEPIAPARSAVRSVTPEAANAGSPAAKAG